MNNIIVNDAGDVDDVVKKIIKKRKIFFVPSSWSGIAPDAFNDNHRVTKIVMGDNIKELGEYCFANCKNLKEVVLSETIKKISASAFSGCSALSIINMPKNLEIIGEIAFSDCSSLKEVILPEGIKNINIFAFSDSGLKKINLPNSLRYIGECSFANCHLETIKIPDKISFLSDETFCDCQYLKKVELGKNITSIGQMCFSNCNELHDINISNTVIEICDSAFSMCYGLKEIKLPDGVNIIENNAFIKSGLREFYAPKELTTLGKGAFQDCADLNVIKLNEKLTYISENCFDGCLKLNQIMVPKNIKIIKEEAFLNCNNLKEVILEEGIETICSRAFEGCRKLTEVKIPKSVKLVEKSVFDSCTGLNKIVIPKSCAFKSELPFNPAYITYENGEFTITKKKRKEAYKCTEDMIGLTLLNFENREKFYKQMEDTAMRDLYDSMFSIMPWDRFEEFIKNKNLKFYKRLYKTCGIDKMDKDNMPNIYKFLYNMGAFEGKRLVEIKTKSGTKQVEILPAQKVCEYFINSNFNFHMLAASYLKEMKIDGYKHEFTEFVLSGDNFEKMIDVEGGKKKNFFAKCYNEFEEIQGTNTSNKGGQRQLKPTMEKFLSYYKTNKFSGITKETAKLAETISPYFAKQETFDRAKEILIEHDRQNLPKSLIEIDKYNVIDECALKIASLAEDSLKQIVDIAERVNYEWLKKNDERIFILGKLCGCCAHAEGQGYGIMKASIVDPNVQNLVIKDGNLIIAKATIYVNPEEGYAVINTVSLKEDYIKHSSQVYKKLVEGINAFARAYNESHNKKLKVITAGMNLNGVEGEIRQNARVSDILYEALDYGKYGVSGARYMGDSRDEQYIIWEAQNGKEM